MATEQEETSEVMQNLGIRQEKTGWSKSYRQVFDSVWRAAQITLKYPISVNNVETGLLETDWVRSEDGYQGPLQTAPSPGTRFKIQITMVRGISAGKQVTRVTVKKNIEKRHDFFSDGEPLASDGLEEKVLLYRIDRELVIDEALKRAATQPSSPTN